LSSVLGLSSHASAATCRFASNEVGKK
jgi:hypothetical protein